MTTTISDFIAKEKELLENATPGPWRYLDEYLSYGPSFVRPGEVIGTCQVFSAPIIEDDDAAFIANVRTSHAQLLEIVEILSEALENMECICESSICYCLHTKALAKAEGVLNDKA
jgi:hypothetical protein